MATAGLTGAACGVTTADARQAGNETEYRVYVTNESSDAVSRVVYTASSGARVESRTAVGLMITDIDGPHGVAVSPDARYWYVSLAHGTPFGRVLKYVAGADTVAGRVELGHFPASMATTPDGEFLYVVNFNLHGAMEPSSVSIVHTPTMLEVARPVTCVMPHGSRFNESGTRQYSTCMMDDQLVEIDTGTLEVSARVDLTPGREGALPPDAVARPGGHGAHAAHAAEDAPVCSPTWAQPGRGRWAGYVYVTCNRSNEVLEIDMASGSVARRFAAGAGPYNAAVTPDGRQLLVTLKADQGVQVYDLERGVEAARLRTSRPVTHGVVVSPDGRYAFVTNEAVGSTRGTLDVVAMERLEIVATVELEHQPGGVDFWTMTPLTAR